MFTGRGARKDDGTGGETSRPPSDNRTMWRRAGKFSRIMLAFCLAVMCVPANALAADGDATTDGAATVTNRTTANTVENAASTYDGLTSYDAASSSAALLQNDQALDTASEDATYALGSVDFAYKGSTVDVLTTVYSFNVTAASGTFDLTCTLAEGSSKPAGYLLYQQSNRIAYSVDGAFTGIDATKLKADETVFICMVDAVGNVLNISALDLEPAVLEVSGSTNDEARYSFGKEFEIEIKSGQLKGQKISLPAIALPGTMELDKGRNLYGMNIDVTKEAGKKALYATVGDVMSWKNASNEAKQALTDNKYGGGSKSFDFMVAGYLMKPNKATDSPSVGAVYVEAGVTVDYEGQWTIIVYGITFSASASAGVGYSYTPGEGLSADTFDLNFAATLKIYGGIGVAKVVSIGLYGSGTVNITVRIAPISESGITYGALSGEVGFELRILIWKNSISFLRGTWTFYPNEGVLTAGGLQEAVDAYASVASIDLDSTYDLISRDYLGSTGAWNAQPANNTQTMTAAGTATTKLLQSNIFNGPDPQIITCGTTTMMVYVADAGTSGISRTDANRTHLVYSLYDKTTDTWSAPIPVETTDDGTADFAPRLATDGTNIYLVWEDAKTALASNDTLRAAESKLDLSAVKYDAAQGKFVSLGAISGDANDDTPVCEMASAITCVDGIPYITWVENESNDTTTLAGKNTIKAAAYKDGAWKVTNQTTVTQPVGSLDIGELQGKAMVAYTLDGDANIRTTDDESVCAMPASTSGAPTTLRTGSCNNAQFAKKGGEDILTIYDQGNLLSCPSIGSDFATEIAVVVEDGEQPHGGIGSSDYRIFGDLASKACIAYTATTSDAAVATDTNALEATKAGSTGKAKLCLLMHDATDGWGEEVMGISPNADTNYIEQYACDWIDGNLLSVYSSTQATVSSATNDGEVDVNVGQTDLYSSNIELDAVAEVTKVEYDEDSYVPGNDFTVTAVVLNNGTETIHAEDGVPVRLLDSNGSVLQSTTVDTTILPGCSDEIKLPAIQVPNASSISGKVSYTVEVGDNSTKTFSVGEADLEVSTSHHIINERESITATVKNKGFEEASGTLVFYDYDTNKTIFKASFPNLGYEDVATYTLYPSGDNGFFKQEGHDTAIGVRVETTSTQRSTSNDTAITPIWTLARTITPSWTRIAGDSRYATATAICAASFDSADTVIIATGQNFPDALSASAYAGTLDAPILFVSKDEVPQTTLDEIARLGATKAIIVGGTGSVGESVATTLSDKGLTVSRIDGTNRLDTALNIYKAGKGSWSKTAIIATGQNFPDALSVAPYAYATKSPLFLVDASGLLSDAAKTAIADGGFDQIIIVGGVNAVSDQVKAQLPAGTTVTRLSGENRYQTSAAIAAFAQTSGALSYDEMAVCTGSTFPDALAGATYCGRKTSVLLLVDDNGTGLYGINGLIHENRSKIITGVLLGGEKSISSELKNKIEGA